jgi:hypothetical protein
MALDKLKNISRAHWSALRLNGLKLKYGYTQYILNSYPDLMEHEIGLNSTEI